MTVRRPSHAGSWYDRDAAALTSKIEDWFSRVDGSTKNGTSVRAVIGPHAGYSYCGHVLAEAFRHVQPEKVRRVFMLGPSHHFYSKKCLLSQASVYACPNGDFQIDQEVYAQLKASKLFDMLTMQEDEAEHSLEMHLPFMAHVFRSSNVTIVPIVVGSLSSSSEAKFGELLAPYLRDDSNLFALSSDFCHWGPRFGYTPYDASQGAVHEYIEALDSDGMRAIETGRPDIFEKYLKETGNTICGRHAIQIYLHALQYRGLSPEISFLKYDQSSRATSTRDSSVSYAAALITAAA